MKTTRLLFNANTTGPYRLCLEGGQDEVSTMAVHAYPPYPDYLAPTFTPLSSITVTNVGSAPIDGLRVLAGRPQTPWRLNDVVDEVVANYSKDQHRVRAIFEFMGQRFHYGQDPEFLYVNSSMKFKKEEYPWSVYPGYEYERSIETYGIMRQLHCYGSGNCVTACILFNGLCQAAGYRSRLVHLQGHFVSEVYHDGQWRMYDPLCRLLALKGGLPLGVAALNADPTLTRHLRWHHPATLIQTNFDHSFGNRLGMKDGDLGTFSCYTVYDSGFPEQETKLDFVLSPGDQLTWRTNFSGLFHAWITPNAYNWVRPPHRVASGTLKRTLMQCPTSPSSTSVTLPYPIVGGRLTSPCRPACARLFTTQIPHGHELQFTKTQEGWVAWLDQVITPLQASALHRLDVILKPGQMQEISLEIEFQVNPDALPGLTLGENTIAVVADSPSPEVVLDISWEERCNLVSEPPRIERLAVDPDGYVIATCTPARTAVAAYHFQVGAAGEPFAAISYGFERVTEECWARFSGLDQLDVGTPYQIRVRAQSRDGVWSPWSRWKRFTRSDFMV